MIMTVVVIINSNDDDDDDDDDNDTYLLEEQLPHRLGYHPLVDHVLDYVSLFG